MRDTREEILQTAIELFKEEGYEQVPITKICKECGITKGTFYYHFRSKHDIIFFYYDQMYHDLSRIMSEVIPMKSAREKLWKLFEYSIDITIDLSPGLVKSLLVEDALTNNLRYFSPYRAKNAGEFHRNSSNIEIELIKQAQADREISRLIDPKKAFEAYTAAAIGVALDWSSVNGGYDQKERMKNIFDVIFHK